MSCGVPREIALVSMERLTSAPSFDRVAGCLRSRPLIVYLWGSNGNGKTHMGTWLMSQQHARNMRRYYAGIESGANHPYPTALWTTSNALTAALRNYSKGGFDYEREQLTYTRPTLLLIDDLLSDRASEVDVANLVEIIESRRTSGLQTIVTSNLAMQDVANVSRRLSDRLQEGETIQFAMKSHRVIAGMKSQEK